MGYIRQLSTQRLLALIFGMLAAVAAGGAIALAATGGGPKPPAKPLAVAVHDALTAPRVDGVTARIRFTNHLIDSSGIEGGDPLIKGASGRLWAAADGRVRIELQSDAGGGDAQAATDGRSFTVYDPGAHTVYRGAMPQGHESKAHEAKAESGPPSVARIQRELTQLSRRANLSGAKPSDVAGKAAYTVRVEPKHDGGLLGGAELAWDAARGVPLRAAVYAAGSRDPVLQLEATDVSYGKVSASDLTVRPPRGAKVVDLGARGPEPGLRHRKGAYGKVEGAGPVRRAVKFPLAAPRKLVGLPRTSVRLIRTDGTPAAVVTYGRNLGGIAVIESPAGSSQPARHGRELTLPKVSIKGTTGEELDTALGTMVRFQRGGVSYVVVGSVPPVAAEAAARGL